MTVDLELCNEIARKRFGVDALHPWQAEAIAAVIGTPGRALVVAPTGGGKSLCYQLPAVALGGTTLVVSPLISLMEDQVRGLQKRGISATYLAATLSADERRERLQGVRRGEYSIVYAAPERLSDRSLVPREHLALLAVDEAHCIVQWGQDFRPDYLRIGELIARERPPRVMACTATATLATRQAILRALHLEEARTAVILRGFARPNLALSVQEVSGPREATALTLQALEEALGSPRMPEGAAIVYASTRKKTEQLAEALGQSGWRASPYHAGLPSASRARCSAAFAAGKLSVVVATNAFGMGIDRADVRVVVHAQPPGSIEAYYQEVGRAGRDGQPARALLCIAAADIPLRRRLLEMPMDGAPPDAAAVARAWSSFRDLLTFVDARSCRHDFILRHFGDEAESLGGCGHCDVCRDRAAPAETMDEARSTDLVRKALAGVARTQRRTGLVGVGEMLRGVTSERARRAGLDSLSTFGLLADLGDRDVLALMRATVAAGYVGLTDGEFPLPYVTETGGAVMRATLPCAIRLRLPRAEAPRPRARPRARREAGERAAPSSAVVEQRFEALRAARTELAREGKVPPYVIAHDTALLAVAEADPPDPEALAGVHGWGRVKAERYGDRMLAALRAAAAAAARHPADT